MDIKQIPALLAAGAAIFGIGYVASPSEDTTPAPAAFEERLASLHELTCPVSMVEVGRDVERESLLPFIQCEGGGYVLVRGKDFQRLVAVTAGPDGRITPITDAFEILRIVGD